MSRVWLDLACVVHHFVQNASTDVQTTSLARELRVQFGQLMANLLELEDVLGSAGFRHISNVSCTLRVSYFMRFLLFALVPIAAVVLPVLFQVGVFLYHRHRRRWVPHDAEPDRTLREYVSASAYTVFTLLVLSYTPVVRQVRYHHAISILAEPIHVIIVACHLTVRLVLHWPGDGRL